MITYKCEEYESIFEFKKEDFREFVFAKKGDPFIQIKRKKQEVKMLENKSVFNEIKYRLTKDLKFNRIKCPICGKIHWKVKELISNPTSLKQHGWYILKYAPELIEVKKLEENMLKRF